MKKICYTIVFVAALNGLHAQGLFGKLKDKLAGSVSKTADGAATNQAGAALPNHAPAPGSVKFTDPATIGTAIISFSSKEMAERPDGYNIWFSSVKVVNNQLVLKIADHNMAVYNYSDGVAQKTNEVPDQSIQTKLPNGSEQDMLSVDFTQNDVANALLKKGSHVTGSQVPGQVNQAYTFNGKVFAHFSTAQLAHNADSTVVAAVGMSIAGGVVYEMIASNGTHVVLPKQFGGVPLVSPDGKQTAALYGVNKQAILANGTVLPITSVLNNLVWLRNSGNVFYFTPSTNQMTLERNGQPFYTFNSPVQLKQLFISDDEHSMCWQGERGLYFSDGTVFENGNSPVRVKLNNKDVIIFTAVNMSNGKVYLCKHDL